MSVLLPLGSGLAVAGAGQQIGQLRAYSDPVIFRDDRVLKTLLRKEIKYLPGNYFQNLFNYVLILFILPSLEIEISFKILSVFVFSLYTVGIHI